ncbi:MAG TPA: hypothetical protein VFJ58_00745 [Armatimonadota bacterium]|nr:hypothetical protein [Armatimonadota bacterium]
MLYDVAGFAAFHESWIWVSPGGGCQAGGGGRDSALRRRRRRRYHEQKPESKTCSEARQRAEAARSKVNHNRPSLQRDRKGSCRAFKAGRLPFGSPSVERDLCCA